MRYLVFGTLILASMRLSAQSKNCDKVEYAGDTTICQYLNRDKEIVREHFYVDGRRIFTRRWTHYSSGYFTFVETLSKGPFAKKNGLATWFYPDGKVASTTYYRHNKRIGPTATYYPSGVLRATCLRHVLKGRQDGLANLYHPNGNIAAKRIFENGRLVQILAYKDDAGNNLPIGTFANGNGGWIQYIEGKPVWVSIYKNGKYKRAKMLKK